MKYFFLVVGKDGSWWLGQAKRSPNELYENFSRELEIHKERYRQIQECKQRSAEEKNDRKTDNL